MSKFTLTKISDTHQIYRAHELLSACGKHMYDIYGLTHWCPYMDISTFKQLMHDKNLYCVYQHSTVIATFNLSTKPRIYYTDNLWSDTNESAIYLGQLGISPTMQNQGLGKWCMQQIEQIARAQNIKSIRFDCLNLHPWLKEFYQKLGYKPCGLVKPSAWELMCFEKTL